MTQPEGMGGRERRNSKMAKCRNHLPHIRSPMGESGTRCYKESQSNGYDERERRGNLDKPTDEVEGLHRLPKAELRD